MRWLGDLEMTWKDRIELIGDSEMTWKIELGRLMMKVMVKVIVKGGLTGKVSDIKQYS